MGLDVWGKQVGVTAVIKPKVDNEQSWDLIKEKNRKREQRMYNAFMCLYSCVSAVCKLYGSRPGCPISPDWLQLQI